MGSPWSSLAAVPRVPRFMAIGAIVAGIIGGIAGLVLGLQAHPPTAWFAVLEIGVPAAIVGALLGALVGLITFAVHGGIRH